MADCTAVANRLSCTRRLRRRNWSAIRWSLISRSIGWISDRIAGVAEGKTPLWWWMRFHSQRRRA